MQGVRVTKLNSFLLLAESCVSSSVIGFEGSSIPQWNRSPHRPLAVVLSDMSDSFEIARDCGG